VKKVLKKILIAAAFMLLTFTAGLLCACSYGPSREDDVISQGYTCRVIYDANGGKFGEDAQTVEILAKPGSMIPFTGYTGDFKDPTREKYTFGGWYVAQTDEEGNIIYEETEGGKTPVLSDSKWDFKKDKVTGDITLLAKWQRDYNFIIVATETDENGNEVEEDISVYQTQPGNTIAGKLYDSDVLYGEKERRPDRIKVTYNGITILEFYLDKELTQELPLDTVHPGGEIYDFKIYIKYLKGNYTFVSQESLSKVSFADNSSWYLLEDVDFSNREWIPAKEFTGSIYGNNHTISGVKIRSQAQKPSAGADFVSHAIFGKMNGHVENLTFKDITFSVWASAFLSQSIGAQKISFLAAEFGENGLFSGVNLENCKIELVNKEKYEPQLNSDSKYYWNVLDDKTQEGYIAKQSVTGVITITEREDPTLVG